VTLAWLCIGWVFASVATAMMPMRRQMIPGLALLAAAPVLIVMVGMQLGWLLAALALVAFLSMYRNPLRYFLARLRGQNPEILR
jgi:uncharacterized membrane protein